MALCFVQLAFVFCVECYFVVKSVTLHTHTHTHNHRRSCYRDNGDKSPPWQGKELVYQEPESIEVLILIQRISSWCLEGYHFQINACPCLLLYERHFKPACLGLAVCLLQDTNEITPSQEGAECRLWCGEPEHCTLGQQTCRKQSLLSHCAMFRFSTSQTTFSSFLTRSATFTKHLVLTQHNSPNAFLRLYLKIYIFWTYPILIYAKADFTFLIFLREVKLTFGVDQWCFAPIIIMKIR